MVFLLNHRGNERLVSYDMSRLYSKFRCLLFEAKHPWFSTLDGAHCKPQPPSCSIIPTASEEVAAQPTEYDSCCREEGIDHNNFELFGASKDVEAFSFQKVGDE